MHGPIATCNLLLILAISGVSWVGFRNGEFERKYIFQPQAILAGKEYHRLLTSAFLHAGWGHLLWNMLSLYIFGAMIEFVLGPWQLLVIFFGSVLGGNLLSLYVHRHHEYFAYGASGGVCGMIFAQILLDPSMVITQLPLPIGIPGWLFAPGFMLVSFLALKANKDNIGHDTHLGGAIIGLMITAALHPSVAWTHRAVFLVVLGVAVLLLVYLWLNPLFLPLLAFFERPSRRLRRAGHAPTYKREPLEVDALLEKINEHGMESLSSEERQFLEQVSDKYQRRTESKKPESGLAI